jgi:threonine synthase
MDIQVSSNFERLLFEASGRDAAFVRDCMADLASHGKFELPPAILADIRRTFSAYRASREEAAEAMRVLYRETGYLADPHSAVALVAAQKHREAGGKGPIIVLGTAHPAKFPEAVTRASGAVPPTPPRLEAMLHASERTSKLSRNASAVATYINQNTNFAALAKV